MRLVFRGEGMPIRNHEKGILALQFLVIFQRAEKIAEMEPAGGTRTA